MSIIRRGSGREDGLKDGEDNFLFISRGITLTVVGFLEKSPVSFPSAAISMITWKTITKKMTEIENSSHTSTILKYDVLGSDVDVWKRERSKLR